MMRALLSIFLIFNLMNLSIEIWNCSVLLAELNEEAERVIEDPVSNDALTIQDISTLLASEPWLADYRNHHIDEFSQSCDYFEIDSPPPDLG
ncbi:MAG: hypothetical protein HQ500_13285 [Flavobacteriales bacterium]|nr:hypothetical protein [Flavobacteriales bacterium]